MGVSNLKVEKGRYFNSSGRNIQRSSCVNFNVQVGDIGTGALMLYPIAIF